jgi:ABC-2 type transport system ATP-binding protein
MAGAIAGTRSRRVGGELPPARLRRITKRYREITALDRLDLAIGAGGITAVLGPNGAGKTTAVQLMLGLRRPTSGVVEIFGGSPGDARNRMRMGAMVQVSAVPETLRVAEHVELFSSYYPTPLPLGEVLGAAGLRGLERRPYGKLSGGQQRRLGLALALCGDPDLLLLDEPTVGMDVESRRQVWNQIRERAARGGTVVLTTHYLDEADALADRVVVLQRGRIVADGTPAAIKAKALARRVRCRSGLSLEAIRGLPGVRQASSDRDSYEILTGNAEQLVRELLARDPDLADLQVTSAGLEDAFLALTQEAASVAC